jgi:hypothetical protein
VENAMAEASRIALSALKAAHVSFKRAKLNERLRLGTLCGVADFPGSVETGMFGSFQRSTADFLRTRIAPPETQGLRMQGQEAIARPGGLAAIANLLRQQATNAGFADAIFCLVPVAAAGVVLAAFLRRAPRAARG